MTSPASHPVREALAHLDDLELQELTDDDLDRLAAAAAAFGESIRQERARRG